MWNMHLQSLLHNKLMLIVEWLVLLVNCMILHFAGLVLLAEITLYQDRMRMGMGRPGIGGPEEVFINTDTMALYGTNLIVVLCFLTAILLLMLCGVIYALWVTVRVSVQQEQQENALLEAMGYRRGRIRRMLFWKRSVLAILASILAWGCYQLMYREITKIFPMNLVFRYDSSLENMSVWIHIAIPIVLLALVWFAVMTANRRSGRTSVVSRLYGTYGKQ